MPHAKKIIKTEMTPEEYELATKLTDNKISAKQKVYVDNDGIKFTYSQMCEKVQSVLRNETWRAQTIFQHMNMEHIPNVHLLPTMAHDNIVEPIRRGTSDTLFYRKLGVNLLQELLHPKPKFKIKGVTRVHMR